MSLRIFDLVNIDVRIQILKSQYLEVIRWGHLVDSTHLNLEKVLGGTVDLVEALRARGLYRSLHGNTWFLVNLVLCRVFGGGNLNVRTGGGAGSCS